MEILSILGYLAAMLIGLSLGIFGGGGSILAVPVLVYLFKLDPTQATAYSLFVVGITSIFGTISFIKQKQIDYKTAVIFGIPSFISVYLVRRYLVPALPESLFEIGGFIITRDIAIMSLFAIIMLLAGLSMIRKKKELKAKSSEIKYNYPMIFAEGTVVGGITGLVGAGGGFMIVPALVLLSNLEVKYAIGVSLLIISIKSLIGFSGDVLAEANIDWSFLLIFTALSIVGIFFGTMLAKKIDSNKLKTSFGWFVLIMAVFIISKELFDF